MSGTAFTRDLPLEVYPILHNLSKGTVVRGKTIKIESKWVFIHRIKSVTMIGKHAMVELVVSDVEVGKNGKTKEVI